MGASREYTVRKGDYLCGIVPQHYCNPKSKFFELNPEVYRNMFATNWSCISNQGSDHIFMIGRWEGWVAVSIAFWPRRCSQNSVSPYASLIWWFVPGWIWVFLFLLRHGFWNCGNTAGTSWVAGVWCELHLWRAEAEASITCIYSSVLVFFFWFRLYLHVKT